MIELNEPKKLSNIVASKYEIRFRKGYTINLHCFRGDHFMWEDTLEGLTTPLNWATKKNLPAHSHTEVICVSWQSVEEPMVPQFIKSIRPTPTGEEWRWNIFVLDCCLHSTSAKWCNPSVTSPFQFYFSFFFFTYFHFSLFIFIIYISFYFLFYFSLSFLWVNLSRILPLQSTPM